jgi:citronellol/citronellal dehydrogenase
LFSTKNSINMSFKNKTVFITGATRGIGLAIGKRLAQEGANIVIAAKTADPHPKLEGTIFTAAAEIEAAGGKALPVLCDVREEEMVDAAVAQAIEAFGGIDILINNASAINLSGTLQLPMKRYDLMHQVNGRATFMVSQKCLPHLFKSENPHILNISPPLNFTEKWFAPHVAYSMAKYNMSLCVLGMAGEFRDKGVAVNALWPRTTIATAAVQNLLGGDEIVRRSRKPEIMADAAFYVLSRAAKATTGNFFIDDEVLAAEGITDLDQYAVVPGLELMPDFFV